LLKALSEGRNNSVFIWREKDNGLQRVDKCYHLFLAVQGLIQITKKFSLLCIIQWTDFLPYFSPTRTLVTQCNLKFSLRSWCCCLSPLRCPLFPDHPISIWLIDERDRHPVFLGQTSHQLRKIVCRVRWCSFKAISAHPKWIAEQLWTRRIWDYTHVNMP